MSKKTKKKNVKKLGVVRIKHIFAEDAMSVLRPLLQKENIEIVFDESYLGSERDYNSLISKVTFQKDNVDETLFLAFSPSAEKISDQMKRHGMRKISAIETFDYSNDLSAFEGSWYVSCSDINAKYAEEAGKQMALKTNLDYIMAAFTADMVLPLFEGYEKSTSANPSREEVADYIRSIGSCQGFSNELEFRPTGEICLKPLIKKVTNGKGVKL